MRGVSDLVERAKDLAHRAHAGQVDKAGRPYIEHVARVAARVAGDDEAEAAAWAHDIREDSPAFSCEVSELGDEVLWACLLLDRGTIDNSREYYSRIRANPLALRVKLADIADNMDEARLALLDEATSNRLRRKYAKALEALGVAE